MKSQRVIARFVPQAWVNGHAIVVDPKGETEWDATEAFGALPESYREFLTREMEDNSWPEGVLDVYDFLHDDPNAPEWVRDWSGPFDIYVRFNNLKRRNK